MLNTYFLPKRKNKAGDEMHTKQSVEKRIEYHKKFVESEWTCLPESRTALPGIQCSKCGKAECCERSNTVADVEGGTVGLWRGQVNKIRWSPLLRYARLVWAPIILILSFFFADPLCKGDINTPATVVNRWWRHTQRHSHTEPCSGTHNNVVGK